MYVGRFHQMERGDTLIEVIFATAVVSLLIVIAFSIMNQGTASAERAAEGTFVRQQIDSQGQMLRYARDSYIDGTTSTVWQTIYQKYRSGATTGFDNLNKLNQCVPKSKSAFYLYTNAGALSIGTKITTPQTYAMANASSSQGLWIEATPAAAADYIDFYIYACWESPVNGPNSTTGTVVRLYAPAP